MLSNLRFLVAAAAVAATFASCQKVIDIDLNSSDPKLVIEAELTNTNAPATVHLTRSVNFSDSNNVPAETNAVVTISDNAGNTATLAQTSAGVYQTSALVGTAGRTYTLTVKVSGNTYTAQSTMPTMVKLDTLYIQNFAFFGQSRKVLYPIYTDPAGIPNYYNLVKYLNGRKLKGNSVREDRLSDGKKSSQPIGVENAANNPDKPQIGDTLTVELQSIDPTVYQFYNTLDRASSGQSVPANPDSNVQGGAYGYFSAHTVNKRWVVW